MENNPLTLRATSFSIASLITSDCADDEQAMYHTLINSAEPHFTLNHCAMDKATSDYRLDAQQCNSHAFAEQTNEYHQQDGGKKREHRPSNAKAAANSQKSSGMSTHVEGRTIDMIVFVSIRLDQTAFNRPRRRSNRHYRSATMAHRASTRR